MATCIQCYNRSCPQPVDVTLTQNLLILGEESAVVETYTEYAVTAPTTTVTLPYAAVLGFAPSVYINGLLQTDGVNYILSSADRQTITFYDVTFDNDVVQVVYARLVP